MQRDERIRRRLRVVQVVALIDLVLLVTLITAAVTRQQNIVHVLGPIHGINYLLLLVIVSTATIDGLWGWWFPLLVLLTAGPPGAFIGEWLLRRRSGRREDSQSGQHSGLISMEQEERI